MLDRFAHMAKAVYAAIGSAGAAMLLQSVNEILADGSVTVSEALTFVGVALGVAGITGRVVYRAPQNQPKSEAPAE